MNKIKQLHLDAIEDSKNHLEDYSYNMILWKVDDKIAATKCTEVTKELMKEFADFLYEEPNFTKWASGKTDSQELLDKFIKEYENN